jgi:hypothetical protein
MLIGKPHHRGTTLLIEGEDSPGAGNPTIEVDDIQRFNEFALQCAAGSMDVLASLDGTTFTLPLAVEDKQSITPLVRGTAMAALSIYYFFGNYKALRVRQIGGGAVTGARLVCGKIGRAQD